MAISYTLHATTLALDNTVETTTIPNVDLTHVHATIMGLLANGEVLISASIDVDGVPGAESGSAKSEWVPVEETTEGAGGDDTAAVQAAITKAASLGAGVLFITREAPWLVDPITIDVPGLHIRGMHGAVVQLRTPAGCRIFTATAPNVVFEDLVLDGGGSAPYYGEPGSAYGNSLITFDQTDGGAVRRCTLRNSGNSGIAIWATGHVTIEDNLFVGLGWIGVYAHTFGLMVAYNNRVRRNTFRDFVVSGENGAAVQLVGHTFDPGWPQIGFDISENLVDSPTLLQGITTYGRCENGVIARNRVFHCGWGISLGTGAYSCVVDHNTCRGNPSYGIELAGTTDCTCSGNTVDGRDFDGTPVNETGILIARDQGDTIGGINTIVANNNVRHGLPTSQGIYGSGAIGLHVLGNVVGGYFSNLLFNNCTGLQVHGNQSLPLVSTGGGHLKVATGNGRHNLGSMIYANRFEGDCEEVIRLYAANGYEIRDMVIKNNHLQGITSTYPALQIDTAETIIRLILRDNTSDDMPSSAHALNVVFWVVAGDHMVRECDEWIGANDTADYTVTLPAATERTGRLVTVTKMQGSVYTITVDAGTLYTLTDEKASLTFRSTGVVWAVVASYTPA